MKNAQQKVAEWMRQFGQETPEKPTIPSLEMRKLRAKLMLEECLETIVDGLGIEGLEIGDRDWNFGCILADLANKKSTIYEGEFAPNLEKIADGCADSHVVTLGTEVACGLRSEENFNEVMRSNDTKLWTSEETSQIPAGCTARAVKSGKTTDRCLLVKDASGKVIKSPSYSPANIQTASQI